MRFDDFMDRSYGNETAENKIGNTVVRPSVKDARNIRKSIQEEMQAVNDYIDRAEMAENDAVRQLYLDLAEEERVHFAELEMMLDAVDPVVGDAEDDAEDEIEDMFGEGDDDYEEDDDFEDDEGEYNYR